MAKSHGDKKKRRRNDKGGKNLVATCYDSKLDLKEKYSNALLNCDALETAGTGRNIH
ncbi:hypothetical protein AM587_10000015 [Phytophthora nicotianae]|uniref:Uncharacterized protein n=1 Tax=Phytophthora nicotianae TaxID=4792 RepID=A0A0W8D969_PHYNI|nr:hypothetical protein AM587_10000015 [Phytophthora nicotianae]